MSVRKFKINIDGKTYIAEVEEMGGMPQKQGSPAPAPAASPSTPVAPAAGNAVVAPMPGKIISLKVKKGQTVGTGDVVLILEAMKMEQEIKSSLQGTVEDILVAEGDTVKKEQPLVTIA